MQLLSKDIGYHKGNAEKTTYKATFTTKDGLIHRVDFNDDGKIESLCEYTSHAPKMHVDDFETLLQEIKEVIK